MRNNNTVTQWQHCRRLLLAQWTAFCKYIQRQVLPCRIACMLFSESDTLHFLAFKHTLLWNQENSFLRWLTAQPEDLGSTAKNGFIAHVMKKVRAGILRFIPSCLKKKLINSYPHQWHQGYPSYCFLYKNNFLFFSICLGTLGGCHSYDSPLLSSPHHQQCSFSPEWEWRGTCA